jgi:lipid II:glycine glycyltransferase (peptidoglycan interpeptide bridge formation enzyme)
MVREIRIDEKEPFNSLVVHPVQSWEWGEFKKKTGLVVERLGQFEEGRIKSAYQITFHPVPNTNFTVGYFPRGQLPNQTMMEALVTLGKKQNALYIKLEPYVTRSEGEKQMNLLAKDYDLRHGRVVFTPHTFQMDLTKTEDELMAVMKPKTRYNVNLASRKGVIVKEDNSIKAFETYLHLTHETSKRQHFYAHDEEYHRLMWEILQPAGITHLLTATYEGEILVAWILFVYKNRLYYPYGTSSSKYRNLMASNLMMWEAIKYGKQINCSIFDLWGSLGTKPDPKNPWFGFHNFKEGFGGQLVEFVGTYDLVINPQLYSIMRVAEETRWKLLRLKKRFVG